MSWSPPTPLGDTTGYRIYYNDNDSSDSVDVSGGSTDNYLLAGLQNGDSYTISIIATSEHFHSESVTVDMDVGLGEKIIYCVHTSVSNAPKAAYFMNIFTRSNNIVHNHKTTLHGVFNASVFHCSSRPTKY